MLQLVIALVLLDTGHADNIDDNCHCDDNRDDDNDSDGIQYECGNEDNYDKDHGGTETTIDKSGCHGTAETQNNNNDSSNDHNDSLRPY